MRQSSGTKEKVKKTRVKVSSSKSKSRKTISKSAGKTVLEKQQIADLKKEKEALQDRLLRTLAEMDNMKKRFEKERIQLQDTANADLLLKILPVIDDFERSLKTDHSGENIRQGIEMIHQKFSKTLSDLGLTTMETVGKPFDVELHDALMSMKKKGVPPGMVIEEHEKGYLLNGRVLRHAKVLVSK